MPTKEMTASPLGEMPAELASVLADYGVTPADVHVAEAPKTATKVNFDQLCTVKTPIQDAKGNAIKNNGHTGPIVFLAYKGYSQPEESKYEGYDGFHIFELWSKDLGKVVVTTGQPEGDTTPEVVSYLKAQKPGAIVCIATIGTSSGNHIFRPVPVQQPQG
jgi:hypothetical protein